MFREPRAWLPHTVNLKSNRIALLVIPLVVILVVLGILAIIGNSIQR